MRSKNGRTWPMCRRLIFSAGRTRQDPTGEKVVSLFVAFIQALVSARIEQANDRCRVTVVTHRAAYDVEEPRGQAQWGAVRSMAAEVDEEAKLDFRLVDLGPPTI